jgi:hypothetical protein
MERDVARAFDTGVGNEAVVQMTRPVNRFHTGVKERGNMKRETPWYVLSGLCAVVGLSAMTCGLQPGDQSFSDTSQGGMGKVRLLVTDGPYPYGDIEEARITITSIEIHRLNNDEGDDGDTSPTTNDETGNDKESDNPDKGVESDKSDDDDDDIQTASTDDDDDDAESPSTTDHGGPWVVIFEGERDFDLMNLRNGRTDLLADLNVPAGWYNQMRLIATEGNVVLTTGEVFQLKVPSGAQSGIKLHFDFHVVDQGETSLLLDVDLSRAFRPIPAGNGNVPIRMFHFQPSVAMRLINLIDAASISGLVSNAADGSPLGSASVEAFLNGDRITGTSTESDGSYSLSGLPAGTYRVVFSANGFTTIEVTNIAATPGDAITGIDTALSPE